MKYAIIDPEKCLACEDCSIMENCARKAVIREEPSDKPWVDAYACNGCLKCMTVCKNAAIKEISEPCH